MKPIVKEFIVGAFGLIALFVVLSHSGGFARAVGAVSTGAARDFRVLQGRG